MKMLKWYAPLVANIVGQDLEGTSFSVLPVEQAQFDSATYEGDQQITVSGKVCKKWSNFDWLEFKKKNYKKILIGNKCRNPGNQKDTIWCYTWLWMKEGKTDGEKYRGTWEYCATEDATLLTPDSETVIGDGTKYLGQTTKLQKPGNKAC